MQQVLANYIFDLHQSADFLSDTLEMTRIVSFAVFGTKEKVWPSSDVLIRERPDFTYSLCWHFLDPA